MFRQLLPLLCIVMGPITAVSDVLFLENFDTENLDHWSIRQVHIDLIQGSTLGSLAGRFAYPQWRPGRGKWPSARLRYKNGAFKVDDWRDFSVLKFDARSDIDRLAHLKLRIDDAGGRRAVRIIPVKGGETLETYTVSIPKLAHEIDISQVRLLDFYLSQPSRNYTFILDKIRLESETLKLLETTATSDPFSSGAMSVEASYNRRADVSISVMNEQGNRVGYTQLRKREIELEWWPDSEASSQTYSVVLVARDGEHGESKVRLGEVTRIPRDERPATVAWAASSTEKIFPNTRPRIGQQIYTRDRSMVEPIQIEMARNEKEATQLILLSQSNPFVDVTIDELRIEGGKDVIPTQDCTVRQVGFVKTERPEDYAVDFVGWWPDPLLSRSAMQLAPNESAAMWISIATNRSTPVGVYHGSIEVSYRGKAVEAHGEVQIVRIPLQVTVHQPVLPDSTTVRTAFSLYEHMIDTVYSESGSMSDASHLKESIYSNYRDFVAEHRLNVTHLYRQSPPDLADLKSRAIADQLNAFNLINLPTRAYSQRELRAIGDALEVHVDSLRQMGLVNKAFVYGFDEAPASDFVHLREAFGYIKTRFPDVKTVTTAKDPSFGIESGLDAVVDIWVALTAYYDISIADAARLRGKEVWWYICIAPTHPFANWFIEYPLIQARLLWWMTFKEKVNGVVYYALNRWPNQRAPLKQISESGRTDWNPASFETANGDGCLLYAGEDGHPISSIRFENVRDGIEDYELLHMLGVKEGDGGVASRRLCSQLIDSLTDFSSDPDLFVKTRRQLLEMLDRYAVDDHLN